MSTTLLGLTVLLYSAVAVSELRAGHSGLALVFIAYAVSNVGFIIATRQAGG